MVFTRSKDSATRLYRSIHSSGVHDVTYLHSDCPQSQREQALAQFKEGLFRVIVATDVAGRGLHVDGVAHVVNYELPLDPEDYIHRIGRTGRAGMTGKATSFVSRDDRRLLAKIERMLGRELPQR
jgi:superfamily II DNA/RNA helicase